MKFTIVLICALICGCAAYHSFEELDSKRSKPDQIQKDIFKFIADTVKKVKNDTAPVLEIVKQRIALFKSSIDNSKASILSLSNQLGRQTTWRLIQTINRADEQVTKKVSPRYIGQQLKKLHDEIEKMYGKQLEDKIKDFRKAIKAKPNAQICWDDNKEQLFNYASDTINNFETYLYKEFVNLDKIVEDVRKEIEMFLTQSTADIKTCNETPDTANKCIQDYVSQIKLLNQTYNLIFFTLSVQSTRSSNENWHLV